MTVLAHHAHAKRVKGADQYLLGLAADQTGGALAHFGGGLVGKGDGRNAARGQAVFNQPPDLVRDHPGLARARTSQHKAGAFGVMHGLELSEIETSRHGTD